ncbi:MAG: phage holin family protein [candidate division Zixibacteria bacterium]|nr:phage holin family protein [candidate division Zixibacteria bacterium]MBU1469715.1 phage holin family protein [candidate division Zixibacteria bacterium]MBU2624852.1 phage holin family protein [candidate division Zixibacteria bacterium]
MMKRFLIRWLIYFASIFIVAEFFGLIEVDNATTLIVSALVLGVLNAWLKPILVFVTLPINVLTLGLFVLVINTLLLKLTDILVQGFEVGGFVIALIASVCISIISSILNFLIADRSRFRFRVFRR